MNHNDITKLTKHNVVNRCADVPLWFKKSIFKQQKTLRLFAPSRLCGSKKIVKRLTINH